MTQRLLWGSAPFRQWKQLDNLVPADLVIATPPKALAHQLPALLQGDRAVLVCETAGAARSNTSTLLCVSLTEQRTLWRTELAPVLRQAPAAQRGSGQLAVGFRDRPELAVVSLADGCIVRYVELSGDRPPLSVVALCGLWVVHDRTAVYAQSERSGQRLWHNPPAVVEALYDADGILLHSATPRALVLADFSENRVRAVSLCPPRVDPSPAAEEPEPASTGGLHLPDFLRSALRLS